MKKWSFLDQNQGLTPIGKMEIFQLFEFLVFISLERRFFVLEYLKHILLAYFALKKEVAKMAIFVQKPWVNPFKKMAIFRLFELLVFIA